jgi:hypothetical protein
MESGLNTPQLSQELDHWWGSRHPSDISSTAVPVAHTNHLFRHQIETVVDWEAAKAGRRGDQHGGQPGLLTQTTRC